MDTDAPAIVAGSTTTVKTLADGTLRLSVDIEPRHAQQAFSMFGAPGTSVAIAKLTPEAAQQSVQHEMVEQARQGKPEHQRWGRLYQDLYRLGWFHNPTVAHAFGVSMKDAPSVRIDRIKRSIYDEFGVESMADLEPQYLVAMCDALGVRYTLPASIVDASRGRSL